MAERPDYVFDGSVPHERLQAILVEAKSRPIRIRWYSGAGAWIQRDVSHLGLERWAIQSYDRDELDAVFDYLRAGLGPISVDGLELDPIYQVTGYLSWFGWVFWHRKEEAR